MSTATEHADFRTDLVKHLTETIQSYEGWLSVPAIVRHPMLLRRRGTCLYWAHGAEGGEWTANVLRATGFTRDAADALIEANPGEALEVQTRRHAVIEAVAALRDLLSRLAKDGQGR